MRRLLRYYRQFDELSPDEVSAELRARRDEERARDVVRTPALDLSGGAWHGPPHPEIVNAATFALRRAVNDYADVTPLRNAIAASHDVDPARVVVGHGAGELIRAALRATATEEVALVWPGWQQLPALVEEAGARPVPVDAIARGRTTVLTTPADPTGAVIDFEGGDDWLIVDEALADFADDAPIVDHPKVIQVRSFSKGHAMGGFRVGYAVLGDRGVVAVGAGRRRGCRGGRGRVVGRGERGAGGGAAARAGRAGASAARGRVGRAGGRRRGAVRVAGGLGRGARRRAGVRGARDRLGV